MRHSMVVVGLVLAAARLHAFDHAHARWQQVLDSFVRDGMVDYRGLKQQPALLEAYLDSLAGVSREEYAAWSRERQISFWINAYNAFTVKLIVDHHPIRRSWSPAGLTHPAVSIRQIPGAWDRIRFRAIDREITLDEIEHGILRKKFREPRIHFAIVCASLGCPELSTAAYRAGSLERQLEQAAERFIRNPDKVRPDPASRTLYLSRIFNWFREDFGDLAVFVARYLPAGQARALLDGGWSIRWLPYDWGLNEWKR